MDDMWINDDNSEWTGLITCANNVLPCNSNFGTDTCKMCETCHIDVTNDEWINPSWPVILNATTVGTEILQRSTPLALPKFPYHQEKTNLLKLRKCKMILCHTFKMPGGRMASWLTFEIQIFWNKHWNDTIVGLMSPPLSHIEAKNWMNSLFIGLLLLMLSSFFILNITVSLTLSHCKRRVFVIENSFCFPLIICYSSGEFDSDLCKGKLACNNRSLHLI